jgi:hypothetical protein
MRGHDHLIAGALVLRHKDIHHFLQLHAGAEIEKRFSVVEHSYTLEVATLADIVLQFCAEPARIDDSIVRLLRCINPAACGACGHV